ncbi:hypothetical protein B0H14DRAFT_3656463 [Mycena olivaceomarginata]|nr:hypothetical protein B0H14DRAFT_3656463 [Mycena olivaceomarginata]
MDVYAAQLLGSGQPHDVVYINPTILAAIKSYVQTVVTQYANEPTILVPTALATRRARLGASPTQHPRLQHPRQPLSTTHATFVASLRILAIISAVPTFAQSLPLTRITNTTRTTRTPCPSLVHALRPSSASHTFGSPPACPQLPRRRPFWDPAAAAAYPPPALASAALAHAGQQLHPSAPCPRPYPSRSASLLRPRLWLDTPDPSSIAAVFPPHEPCLPCPSPAPAPTSPAPAPPPASVTPHLFCTASPCLDSASALSCPRHCCALPVRPVLFHPTPAASGSLLCTPVPSRRHAAATPFSRFPHFPYPPAPLPASTASVDLPTSQCPRPLPARPPAPTAIPGAVPPHVHTAAAPAPMRCRAPPVPPSPAPAFVSAPVPPTPTPRPHLSPAPILAFTSMSAGYPSPKLHRISPSSPSRDCTLCPDPPPRLDTPIPPRLPYPPRCSVSRPPASTSRHLRRPFSPTRLPALVCTSRPQARSAPSAPPPPLPHPARSCPSTVLRSYLLTPASALSLPV